MRCPGRALLLVGGLALVTGEAHAGGFEIADFGTVPLGRGGAYVARADGLDAFHYNPAGLSKLHGGAFLLGSNAVHLNSTFERGGTGRDDIVLPWNEAHPDGIYPDWEVIDPALDPNTGEAYAAVKNGKRVGALPFLIAAVGDLGGVEGLTVSLGVLPPTGFGDHQWPSNGPQRYTVRDGDFTFFMGGVGLSYRVNRYFSVGANFLNGFFLADVNFATRGGTPGGPSQNENFAGDNSVRIQTRDLFVPSANVGILSSPADWLELGVSVRAPFIVRSTGSLAYTGSEETPDAALASDALVTIRQQFPTVVRAGARFIHEYFDLEANFVFENYQQMKSIRTTFENPAADFTPPNDMSLDDPSLLYLDVLGDGALFREMNASAVPLNWRNTYSGRLGGDVAVWPGHITVRAGTNFTTSAYPKNNETYSIRFPFSRQVGVSGGLTWHALQNRIDVSVGYQHLFQKDVVVADDPKTPAYDGGIVQAAAFRFSICDGSGSCEPEPRILGNIVNNGRYRAKLDVFGMAVEGHF